MTRPPRVVVELHDGRKFVIDLERVIGVAVLDVLRREVRGLK